MEALSLQMSVAELAAMRAATPDFAVLDVREVAEFAEYPLLPGAIHIALGQLPERFAELDKAKPLAVICRAGGRSGRAVEWLRAKGYNASNVVGGMMAWAGAAHA